MFKKIQDKTIQVITVCFSLVVVLILFNILGNRLIVRYINKLKSEFKLSQNKQKESEELIRNFPNPQKAIEDIENKTQELRDMGLTKGQLPRIIQLLGNSVSGRQIKVISIRPRDDIKSVNGNLPAGVNKVYIEMVMGSSYQLFGDYLKVLTELPVTFVIERLSIEKKEENSISSGAGDAEAGRTPKSPNELSINLLLSTYMVWEL